MRRIFTLPCLLFGSLFLINSRINAQSCVPTNINHTVVNLSCAQTCTDMRFQIPHLKSTGDYVLNTIPYTPFPYVVAGGSEDAALYADDFYSNKIALPFPFCFYDSTFTKAVVGSNGLVTFDTANANCNNAFTIDETIPYDGGTAICDRFDTYYPQASIMGAYSDIDPTASQSPADRKIQWRVEGTAPCRKFVVSYYHVGTFGASCGESTDASGNTVWDPDSSNTFQMVMYESTGLIDVYIENKSCFSTTNAPGLGILGIQNWTRDEALAAPGKNETAWTSYHEGYRFTPNGGTSRFISSGLYTMAGTLVVAADTSTTTAGLLDISFPNICPGATTQYVIKTTFDACPTGTQLISFDTITIAHINTLTATSTTNPSTCGASVGTITATVTGGTGTAPYTYTLNPGGTTNNTGIFTGLAAGPYTIDIVDANGCPVTIAQTVGAVSSLAGTYVSTGTACAGVNNGTVTLTPQGNPPYIFTLTGPGGPYVQPGNVFINLPSGNYTATYTDGSGCAGTIPGVTVNAGAAITATANHTNTTCNGANDGTITITPDVAGSYTFTLNPGAITNATGIFTALPPANYSVAFTNTVTGCAGTVTNINVVVGGSITATWVHTNETCPGAHDGIITITPTVPGTYTFTLNPAPGVGPATNATGIFAGITPGIFYDVSFSNPTGCSGSMTTLFVLPATAVTATEVHTNATCPGVIDGTITVTPSPAAGSYTYTLNPGAIVNTTGIFTSLGPNTYSVDVVNAGGCGTSINNIVIIIGAGATATAVATNATCPGVSDGTITITPPATGAPFIYTLNPGSIVQNNNPVFTGLGPNTYTITFTTAAGCSGTVPVNPVIASGAAPTATAVATNATCPGVNNGTITITPPATGAPFIYTLNPGAIVQNNNPVFTGLAPNTYTITFTTVAGCNGTIPVNPIVGSGAAPTATSVSTSTTCPGVSDAAITVNPPASGGPFIYTLNPGNIVQNNNPVFSGLAAGNYTITFTNAAGCSGTVTTNPVFDGPAPTATSVSVNATCPGVNNGTITITPPVLGGPFVYTLNPGNIVQNNNPVFTGLATGNYTISFTTPAGCIGNVSPDPVVGAGSIPAATSVTANTTCPGVSDGTITVTPPATGAPFIYTLNPGNIVQNNNPVFTGLAANTYTISFTTAVGCTGNVSPDPVVGSGPAPTATAVAANTTCPGVNDGTITVTPPATGGPFIYTLNPGNIVQNNNPVFTGLAPLTYNISFTTAIGCTGNISPDPVVGSGPNPTATAVSVSTTCPGVNDGTITVTPPATGGPFIYTLNPGNIVQNNNPVFTGLAPLTYNITFTTAAGCTGSVSTDPVVGSGPNPTATAVSVSTTCPGVNDGTITVTPPATGGPFIYTLNPGNIIQNNNPVFTGLAANTYTITFTTAVGCTGSVSPDPVVQSGPPLTATYTPGNPPCANINDGTITIVPSLGGVYTYVLNPGLPGQVTQFDNPTFTGLAPGNYTYSFSNASGCTGNGNATLTTHTPLGITVTKTMPLCFSNANGIIELTASGGLAPYEYALSPFTTYRSSGTFNGLTAATYTFRIRDNAGCTKDTTITLTEPTQLAASAVSSQGTCNGNDGQITVTGNLGTPGYTYSIDGITYQASPDFIVSGGPTPGAYYPDIKVKDANGCIAAAVPIYVTLVDNMSALIIGNDTTICAEQSVTFQPQVSAQATVFTWTTIPDPSLVNSLDNDAIKNATATPLDTTTYVLDAAWGVCSRKDTITLRVLHKPIPYAGKDTAVCIDKTTAFLHGSASNLSGTINYEWTDTTNLQTPHSNVTVATPVNTETFTLTVTDNYGCNFSVTDDVTVTVQPPVPAFAGNDTIAVLGQPHQLMGNGGVAYTWSPAYPLNFANIQNPLATLDHDQQFTVVVTDVAGCIGYDTVFVQVYPGPAYHIPNAFSPNGDGLNDVFRVIPAGISYTEWFRVFNRYGELVFETNQWLKGWDGTYLGKKQPIGNYVWILKGLDKNGKVVEMRGTVLLIQ